jgi:2-methylcitrate dehydratase PrpD
MRDDADLSEHFAECATETRFEDLPPDAVEGAKKSVLDTIGVILAASGTEPAVRAVIDQVREDGGAQESSVLAFGGRVPAPMAAFANGAMAHCLDYDDQTPWGQHSGSSLLPAAFAAAEKRGGAPGRDLITAIAIGQDLFHRLRQHVDWRKDWMFTTVIGVFTAAVATARILGLSREQATHAMGIASMSSSGIAEVVNSTGSDLRALYAGFPAHGAVRAALLARRGVTGVPGLFEAKHGVMAQYFGGRYDRGRILNGLGQEFSGGLTLYKRWPTVGTAHSHIHAAIMLIQEHGLRPGQVAAVRLHVGDYHRLMCEPIAARRAPRTLVDAKFSLPFLVAIALVRREVSLGDFTEAGLANPEVLAMAARIEAVDDPALDWKLELPAGRVEIVTTDGRVLSRVGTAIPGSAEAPMSWDEIEGKFRDCAAHSVARPAAATLDAACKLARHLEDAEDATELVRLMAG